MWLCNATKQAKYLAVAARVLDGLAINIQVTRLACSLKENQAGLVFFLLPFSSFNSDSNAFLSLCQKMCLFWFQYRFLVCMARISCLFVVSCAYLVFVWQIFIPSLLSCATTHKYFPSMVILRSCLCKMLRYCVWLVCENINEFFF